MATAWRIVAEKRAASAFSGEGARIAGGRWNSKGTSVVYTSASKALAALELLVHINPIIPLKLTAFRLEFDDEMIEHFPAHDLPAHWRIEPPGGDTMKIGDAWVAAVRSPILAVPSTIIPEEINYLLNPAHPDFADIQIGPATGFAFDPRLL